MIYNEFLELFLSDPYQKDWILIAENLCTGGWHDAIDGDCYLMKILTLYNTKDHQRRIHLCVCAHTANGLEVLNDGTENNEKKSIIFCRLGDTKTYNYFEIIEKCLEDIIADNQYLISRQQKIKAIYDEKYRNQNEKN